MESFRIGVSTIFLVTSFIAVMLSIGSITQVIFLKLAQDTTQESDFTITTSESLTYGNL